MRVGNGWVSAILQMAIRNVPEAVPVCPREFSIEFLLKSSSVALPWHF